MDSRVFAFALVLPFVACGGGDELDAAFLQDASVPRDGGFVRDAGDEVPRDGGSPDAGFDTTTEAIIDIVQPMVDERWYPSVSVAWLVDGEVHHFGFGEVGPGGPAPDDNTLYEIGSVTKTFTGTLLADMAVRGQVDIDDLAQSRAWSTLTMPSREGVEIRLVDLATHFSGLPRLPTNLMPADPNDPYVDYTRDDLDAFLGSYQLPRRPGQSFEYSNLAVGLLGQLLANTASTAYDRLLDERILEPFGMRDTTFVLDAEQLSRLAPGHDYDGEPVQNWDLGIFDPAGGLESSTSDMMIYARTFLDATTSSAAIALATTAQAQISPQVSIGLNWFVVNGGELIFHDGATGGYNALLVLVPSEGRAVVLLANGASYLTNAMGFAVTEAVRGRSYQAPDPKPTVDVDEAVLDQNAGVYALVGMPSLQATVTRVADKLFVQLTNQPTLRLFPTSDRDYYLRAVEAGIVFDAPDTSGVVGAFTLLQDGQTPRFVRMP